MEDLYEIAILPYKVGSQEIKDLAKKFFNLVDTDGDQKITLIEFLNPIEREGCEQMKNPKFFNKLDKDGNDTLDFFKEMKLY